MSLLTLIAHAVATTAPTLGLGDKLSEAVSLSWVHSREVEGERFKGS